MNNVMKTKIFAMLSLGSLLTTGCVNDFLELKPLDAQTEAIYFKNLAQFQAAADNLHANVYAWGGSTTYNINFDFGSDLVTIGKEELNGTNSAGTSDTYYTQAYKWLRPCCQLIEKGEQYANQDEIAAPVGQAHFFRAWHHFFLLKRFGGVALMMHTPDTQSDVVWGPRNSRYEVVKAILDDLDVAIAKLKNTTVASTGNDGHVTVDAAKAFKARVCLFEATWEKYNGRGSADVTNGDGAQSGAGTAMPEGYPSIEQLFTMAKELSAEVINSGNFELFMGVEAAPASGNPDLYVHTSYFYLFNLEGSDSNPAGVSKADNKEAVYRSVYDHTNRKSNTNLTHTVPGRMTRKLIDLYLCTDGLPIHVSPLFKGFKEMNAELENRDYRLTACYKQALGYYWGWGMYGTGADYSADLKSLPANKYQYCPDLLSNSSSGTSGRKFCSELATLGAAGDEAADYMHIRLAEVYLIYAEATCELGNGTISDADLNFSLNKVRARGGIAPLNAALIATAKAKGCEMSYLGEIRRERAVELYGEGHRLSDLCRWGIAEQVLGQERCGAYVAYDGADTYLATLVNPVTSLRVYDANVWKDNIETTELTYEDPAYTSTKAGAVIVEHKANRKFSRKNYLQPIPTDQIKLNPNLKQNPQW